MGASFSCMMVGERGFEPPAPASRRQCSTRLSYSPTGTRTSAREPRPRLDRRGPVQAQAALAAERVEPMFGPNELLARRPGARPRDLGLLDLAPVVIVGRHDPAAGQQALQALGPGPIAGAPGRKLGGDPVGDFIAVGPVGADGSGRPAPRPADGIETVGNAAGFIEEFAAA